MPKELIPLQELEWYQNLIEECRAVIVETKFNSAVEILKGKWELGKRILEEELNFKRAGYGEKIIESVSRDLGISAVHLWKCIQFYKKFTTDTFEKVLDQLPEGKAISWYKVYTLYLPKHKQEEKKELEIELKQKTCNHSKLKCVACGKEFDFPELLELIKEEEKRL